MAAYSRLKIVQVDAETRVVETFPEDWDKLGKTIRRQMIADGYDFINIEPLGEEKVKLTYKKFKTVLPVFIIGWA